MDIQANTRYRNSDGSVTEWERSDSKQKFWDVNNEAAEALTVKRTVILPDTGAVFEHTFTIPGVSTPGGQNGITSSSSRTKTGVFPTMYFTKP